MDSILPARPPRGDPARKTVPKYLHGAQGSVGATVRPTHRLPRRRAPETGRELTSGVQLTSGEQAHRVLSMWEQGAASQPLPTRPGHVHHK